ncbi:hypothetical protein FUAX_38300 (plasmid) [Fulvitalea axinellae]|uniref:Uncharacterized protein n=1 Tax=Fulvitalea axinellae TaxID=1182444 RepID=A0AAU9CMC8_9BACT|nr:hypothetical protein FUAX_38300 [Fulvitalea axinellae]
MMLNAIDKDTLMILFALLKYQKSGYKHFK